jgi:predicted deacylase
MEIQNVVCGTSTIPLEFFDSGEAQEAGPTVVITAGMDGDEYVGMNVARGFIRRFSGKKPLHGRIIIFPCVNVPGFDTKMSMNPHDGKYPKHIYPGNPNGTETDRLIWSIASGYLRNADVWLDLHGGASNERLTPFVWGYRTAQKNVNQVTERILTAIQAPIVIYQKNFVWRKVETLAKEGCAYLVFECGDKGLAKRADIRTMDAWVDRSLGILGIVENQRKKDSLPSSYFDEVHEYIQRKDRWMWKPRVSAGETVSKGQPLGETRDTESSSSFTISARQDGKVLWLIRKQIVVKDDVIVALAR